MKVYQCMYIVPLLIAVFAIALSSSSSSYAVATTSPKKVSKWVADIAKVKKKASAIKNDSKNKKKMLQDHEISDLINGDKKAERANKNDNLPEDEQKRIEKMEEEGKKRQFSMDFNNALDIAQKGEEQIKAKEHKHAEEIAKAKERNATKHAEQLFKRKQRKIEQRKKAEVRHEQNVKRMQIKR